MKKTTIFLFCLWASIAAKAQVITLKGKVIDSATQKGIPYVNIGFSKYSIGTSANEEGVFILKISPKYLNDTLTFSSIGYANKNIVVKNINFELDTIFTLKPPVVNMAEFEFVSLNTKKIIQMVLTKRAENYNTKPVLLQAFCREITKQKERDNYFSYAEGVLEAYKSPVTKNADAVRLLKGRKKNLKMSFNKEGKKHEIPKIVEAPFIPIVLDVVKASDLFLTQYKQFKFVHIGYEVLDNRTVFVIQFEPLNHSVRVLENTDADFFQGKIYIDQETYALVRADFESSPRGIRASNTTFKYKKTNLLLVKRTMVVNYDNFSQTWYFKSAYLENEYIFYEKNIKELSLEEVIEISGEKKVEKYLGINKKDSLLSIFHKVECYVTKIDTGYFKAFNSNETIKQDESLGDEITDYDDSFWGDFNFIKASTKAPLSEIKEDVEKLETPFVIPTNLGQRKINDKSVEFFNSGMGKAKKMAAIQKKFIFIDFYTDWCEPCRKLASEAFRDREVAETMNTFFINMKVNPERGGQNLGYLYNINSYPTQLIIDSAGTVIQRITGYGGVSLFKKIIKRSIEKLPQGALFNDTETSFLGNKNEFSYMLLYAQLRKGYGLPNEILTDSLVTHAPEDTLKKVHYQQFLTSFATELTGKTFEFFLKNKNQPIYERKLQKLILQNLDWAVEAEDKSLLAKVIKANTLVINNPSIKESEEERLENLYKEKVKQKKALKN